MAIDIHCPYCGTARSVAEGEVGHAVHCGKCGADLSFDERIAKASAEASLPIAHVAPMTQAEKLAKKIQQYHGSGCPRCGSVVLVQKRLTTGAGWGLLVGGLVAAIPTFGYSLLLCVIGAFLSEQRAFCTECHWRWRV